MFANRFTVLVDACSLAGALKRNLILTLAEAEFFRLRWSIDILDETERAIAKILTAKDVPDATERATRARSSMESAFADAVVREFGHLMPICQNLPDTGDAHVLAAAIHCQAALIVTENLKDFPSEILGSHNMEAKPADAFIADTLSLDLGRGVAAVRKMRERFKRPEITPADLLLKMEAEGMSETAYILSDHIRSI